MKLSESHLAAWVAVLQTQSQIRRLANQSLDAEGCVSMETYDVLLALEDAPGGSLDLTSLAHRVLLTQSGISRVIDRLEDAGWVEIRKCPNNHRRRLASLTKEGLAERERAWPVYRQVLIQHFASRMTPETAALVAKGLSGELEIPASP